MTLYRPYEFYQPSHCPGCRCFTYTTTTNTITYLPYVPKHRKPGPAQ